MMSKKKTIRLDHFLVENGHVNTLEKSKALIMAGQVVVDDQRCDKPGTQVKESQNIRLKSNSKYVSRGGDKLESAIKHFKLENKFQDKRILDVGSSTGGFTDCVLSYQAEHVIALDVGSNQLAWKFRQHEKVTSLEQTDIRNFDKEKYPPLDWIVGDISFNSISNLLPAILKASCDESHFLFLIKPQFELEAEEIPDGGIVDSPILRKKAVSIVKQSLKEQHLKVIGEYESQVKGRFGNQEIFIYFRYE